MEARRPPKFLLSILASFLGLLAADAADSVVVFNEIQYHPTDEVDDTEWIELHSLMGVDVDLSGWAIDGGVTYTFPEGSIMPGHGFLLVAADPGHPALDGKEAVGPFVGRLANDGETIRLINNNGRIMDVVSYRDGGSWPVGADGLGATLAKRDEHTSDARASNWLASPQIGGTPGNANFPSRTGPPGPFDHFGSLVINEVAPATAPEFRLEIANLGPDEVDLGAYQLRSSAGDRHLFPEMILAPSSYLAISPSFAVAEGMRLALVHGDEEQLTDAREVTARLRGLSGTEWLYPSQPTFGSPNEFDFQHDVVIHEIMYHPRPSREPAAPEAAQWIELSNRGATPVDLTGWRFDDGIDFEFPSGTILAPDAYLLVASDATTLASDFPGIDIAGTWSGRLSRQGEQLRLVDAHGNPVDTVSYYDGGRWPELADGGGSSLELRDPASDNSSPEAWAPSAESGPWQTITYAERATVVPSNDPTLYHEFIFGLLDAGEFLIDDISVIEDPAGAARELIQNGDFGTGSTSRWRMRGNHRHARVVEDPDEPGNDVLYVRATGAMEHMHNHAETTLKDGTNFVSTNSGRPYQISFRAKWLGGSNQLNSRLYFNRVARTSLLDTPARGGTPGGANSQAVPNAGPTYTSLSHAPAVPAANAPATVTVHASDPEDISSITLRYSVDGSEFVSAPMAEEGGGRFSGVIPGKSAGRKVQFYVAARDGQGVTSFFPAAGPDSRAIIPWDDGQADLDYGDCQPNNFRIVMTDPDRDFMHTVTEVMSNDRLGCTVIYNEREIYYDCGVRLKGSQRGRAKDVRVGFLVGFPDDKPFLGSHETVAVDRSGAGDQFSQKEILVKHIINHAGGIPGMQDDLIRVIAPRSAHTGSAMLLKSRYDDEWLTNQFPDGDDGTMFEYELIYYPTSTTGGPEGDKRPNPDSVAGVPMRGISGRRDKELYRYHWQIDNNKAEDDYDALMTMLIAMGFTGTAYQEATDELLDVDQWLRAFAAQVLAGIGDNYSSGSQHNAIFYFRPTDGRAMFFPWDMDFSFNRGPTSDFTPNGDLSKLIAASPANKRAYYGHLLDIVETTFNTDYLSRWARHYSCFLPNENLAGFLSYIGTRSSHARTTIGNVIRQVPFRVTTADGATTNEPFFTLEGNGWVDVREIRLADGAPLPITWVDDNSWEAVVPVNPGLNEMAVQAVGFDGEVFGEQSVRVSAGGAVAPANASNLAITELHYHPAPPTPQEELVGFDDPDAFEFVELQNLSDTETIDLTGVAFVDGVDFTFPSMRLDPKERIIVAGVRNAFETRYGTGFPVVGQYQIGDTNKFSNDGEQVILQDAGGSVIMDFTYNDARPWPISADGDGYSLILMCPGENDPALAESWRSSLAIHGNPDDSDNIPLGEWLTNHGVVDLASDDDGDGLCALLEYASGNDPNIPDGGEVAKPEIVEIDGQPRAAVIFRQQIGADEVILSGEGSGTLTNWMNTLSYSGRVNNGDGTSSVRFLTDTDVGANVRQFLRVRVTAKE